MRSMRNNSRLAFLCLMLSAGLVGGCSANRQVEYLESQLRRQESEMLKLAGELNRTQSELLAARQDALTLRKQLAEGGQQVIPLEQAESFYSLAGIQIDKLQTSYLPGEAGQPGRLAVMVTPVDQFRAALRVPGEITFRLRSGDDEAAPVVERTFTPQEVRELWTGGWVSSGFLLQLPWDPALQAESAGVVKLSDLDTSPASEDADSSVVSAGDENSSNSPEIQPVSAATEKRSPSNWVLEATFRTGDGREFSARHTLTEAALRPQQPARDAAPQRSASPPAASALPPDSPPEKPIRQTSAVTPENGLPTSDRRSLEEFPVYR